jgi:phage FluMu protein Com|tara:strand:- start:330 stop:614 length:285 start_codon:yes stop_codon:yes gene_type:complete
MGEKKCPNCGKWSEWNQNLSDTCEHCGEILAKTELAFEEKRAAQKKINEEQWVFFIKEDDSDFVKKSKKVGNFFYSLYITIITIIAWLIAALPG